MKKNPICHNKNNLKSNNKRTTLIAVREKNKITDASSVLMDFQWIKQNSNLALQFHHFIKRNVFFQMEFLWSVLSANKDITLRTLTKTVNFIVLKVKYQQRIVGVASYLMSIITAYNVMMGFSKLKLVFANQEMEVINVFFSILRRMSAWNAEMGIK